MKFGLVEPTSQTENPMSWGDDQFGKNPWEIISQDPEWLEAFDISMKSQDEMMPITGIYEFNELKEGGFDDGRKVMVDVGGGRGQAIKRVLEEYPDLPASGMVLQDRDVVIDAVKKSGELPEEVEKMPIDFYKEQPVKGQYIFSSALSLPTASSVSFPTSFAESNPNSNMYIVQERNPTISAASSTTSRTPTSSLSSNLSPQPWHQTPNS